MPIRDARPEDKERVLAFTARTWEFGDYIAEVWDAWLADRQGRFLVAEQDGVPVATSKVTWLAPDEAWLEGLRVDPEHRGRGVARAMHDTVVAWATQQGARTIRFVTGSDNYPIHHMAFGSGFRLVSPYHYVTAPSANETVPQPEALTPADMATVATFLEHSEQLRACGGLCADSWRWPELTHERMEWHLAAGEVLSYRETGGLSCLALVFPSGGYRQGPWLAYLDGAPDAMAHMGLALRRRLPQGESACVQGHIPAGSPAQQALERAGYAAEFTLWVMEKRL
ncbi:MAG: GNAT family N-acetyltransferase [Chloroflexi bacterium]|nr:GNAT family N-acetyltransferase [Chloroflexota bacterium]